MNLGNFDERSESIVAQTVEPEDSKISVKFRKGQTNDKDLFIEVWNDVGFLSSLKVTEKLKMPYNDTLFGGI